MMRHAMGSAASAIIRVITERLRIDMTDRQKPILVVEACRAVEWASLTFEGERITLDLRLVGASAGTAEILDRLGAAIAESHIPIAGSFVAEIGLTIGDLTAGGNDDTGVPDADGARRFVIEALVIRD